VVLRQSWCYAGNIQVEAKAKRVEPHGKLIQPVNVIHTVVREDDSMKQTYDPKIDAATLSE
jgi:hypothetical protein